MVSVAGWTCRGLPRFNLSVSRYSTEYAIRYTEADNPQKIQRLTWAAWRTLVYAAWVDAVAMGRAGVRRGGVLCRLRGAFVGDGAFSGRRAMAFVGGREACRCRPELACLQKIAIFLRRNASV